MRPEPVRAPGGGGDQRRARHAAPGDDERTRGRDAAPQEEDPPRTGDAVPAGSTPPGDDDRVSHGPAGLPGAPVGERVTGGPVKIILDDDRLPDLDTLAARFAAAHRAGHPVAVHCVTRVQTVLTLAALAAAGPRRGDRIEHGAVVPPELRGELRRGGLTVVTQPNFVAERGDRYLVEVTDEDPASLYPAASLARAGVGLAAGTDAPFGNPDPWLAIRAAIVRRTVGGMVLGADERLDAHAALALFLGHPADPARLRTIRLGAPADLCLLRRPLAAVLADPSAAQVRRTVVAGTPVP
jgi:predicted amidohydrolase YtcJ